MKFSYSLQDSIKYEGELLDGIINMTIEFIENEYYCILEKKINLDETELILEMGSKIFDYLKLDITSDYNILINDIFYGIRNNEFYLVYQPKVNNFTRAVVGLEGLIRWNKNDSIITPDSFIPYLEKMKCVHLIDFFSLKRAIDQIICWKNHNEQIIPISINMCSSTLLRKNFFREIKTIISDFKYTNYIEIEITERNITLEKFDEISRAIKRLKEMKFSIAIDDYGAGSTNINLLICFDIDTLKLDKTIVSNLEYNYKAQKILKSLLSLCKTLNIRVIAEGVERKDQLEVLTHIGSETSQGYYFSKPVFISEVKFNYPEK